MRVQHLVATPAEVEVEAREAALQHHCLAETSVAGARAYVTAEEQSAYEEPHHISVAVQTGEQHLETAEAARTGVYSEKMGE